MTITVEIPDNIAGALAAGNRDPARVVLETIALEGYRTDRLSEYQVQQLLGFDYFEDVHRFFNEHDVYPSYTAEELDRDTEIALEVTQIGRRENTLADPQ